MNQPADPKPTREKLVLTKDQARDILSDDQDEYQIIEDKVVSNQRWSTYNRLVIQRISDGRFFATYYSAGATEQQEERPWEYEEPNFREVFPTQQIAYL